MKPCRIPLYEVPEISDPVARYLHIKKNARQVSSDVINAARDALDANDVRRRLYEKAKKIGSCKIAPKGLTALRGAPSGLLIFTDSGTTQHEVDWTDWIAINEQFMSAFNTSGWHPWQRQGSASELVDELQCMTEPLDPRSARTFPSRLWKII